MPSLKHGVAAGGLRDRAAQAVSVASPHFQSAARPTKTSIADTPVVYKHGSPQLHPAANPPEADDGKPGCLTHAAWLSLVSLSFHVALKLRVLK